MNAAPLRQRSGFHISLKWLLLSIVPISFGAASLESATAAWAAAAVTFTLLAIFGTVVATKFDARRRRPIWLGFAIFAGGYLVVLYGAPRDIVDALGTEKLNRLLLESCHPGVDYPPEQAILMRASPADERRSRQTDSAIFMALFGWLGDQPAASDSADSATADADANQPTNNVLPGNSVVPISAIPTADLLAEEFGKRAAAENFKEIARSAWAWLFGACGACLANCLAIRNATASADLETAAAETADKEATPSRARIVGTALLIAGAVLAGGFAVWRAHPAWSLIVFSAVAIASLVAAIGALFGDPRRSAFRAGFAIYCSGYFLFCAFANGGTIEDGIGVHSFFQSTVMAKSLQWLWDSEIPTKDIPIPSSNPSETGLFGVSGGARSAEKTDGDSAAVCGDSARPSNARLQDERWLVYFQTGHCLWALALGWMGGGLAQFLTRRRSENRMADPAAAEYKTEGATDVFD